MAEEAKKVRSSKITRGIKRTLSTAQFETLVIEIGFEEEIEWSTPSERQRKINNWNTILIKDFQESSDRILQELGITHKKAYFKNPSPETIEKYKTHAKSDASARGLDLDDLDSLDTLENGS
jgi:hypothetical protein